MTKIEKGMLQSCSHMKEWILVEKCIERMWIETLENMHISIRLRKSFDKAKSIKEDRREWRKRKTYVGM